MSVVFSICGFQLPLCVTPVKIMMINLERGKDEGIVTMINGTCPFFITQMLYVGIS
jgi:hypothetical protein